MKAMIIPRICDLDIETDLLEPADVPIPLPGPGEVLIKVKACGVCHTELDEISGRTPPPRLPVIPGHQVVGLIEQIGPDVTGLQVGQRVGVAWIYKACGRCRYCQQGLENLCPQFVATGRDVDGGYAEYIKAVAGFIYAIPAYLSDAQAVALLCAGAVGYRAVRLARLARGHRLGLSGFGASAHIVLKIVRYLFPEMEVFVFARQQSERDFAIQLGVTWAGDFHQDCPVPLDAIIDTTPVWSTIVRMLRALAPGGRLVINAIRKEDHDKHTLLDLDYGRDLWMEHHIQTVANVTRQDVKDLLDLAGAMQLRPEVQIYRLEQANQALIEIKQRRIRGAKVLLID
ncbi:MAG: zinc-dependent alcohol dehydrogenase family protein [Sedimentisphaerales bacterium]|jgi:propanol-preferring alcohol dehydrogenase|nr:zinc-dependent alcohol dehydrogenase family protein [Sedimentisphaerales bacterium]